MCILPPPHPLSRYPISSKIQNRFFQKIFILFLCSDYSTLYQNH